MKNKPILFLFVLFLFSVSVCAFAEGKDDADLYPLASSAYANFSQFPENIKQFLENAETCQHFADEADSQLSAERQKQIEDGLNQYCGAAHKIFESLKQKYKNNPNISKALENYNELLKNFHT
jgi:hypothetical protein